MNSYWSVVLDAMEMAIGIYQDYLKGKFANGDDYRARLEMTVREYVDKLEKMSLTGEIERLQKEIERLKSLVTGAP